MDRVTRTLFAVLLLAVVITPFIDNVSTAIVLSPIAAGIASRTGVPVEPLLMAVAVGASLDFLTPFGHHNNAVVMGAARYRFIDFPRFGAPLLGALPWLAEPAPRRLAEHLHPATLARALALPARAAATRR